MKTVNLTQGTPEWKQWRASRFTASDAPVMLGISPYRSRESLLREKAIGEAPEHSDATLALFAEGHRAEVLARAMLERMIDDELYPAVVEDEAGQLAASMDGMTLDGDTLLSTSCSTMTCARAATTAHPSRSITAPRWNNS
jgi:putative phage-type endonuclease